MVSRSFMFIIYLLVGVLGTWGASTASQQKPTEYDVKAAFIYNFAKFVEWPPEKAHNGGAAINVCIAGDDPFGPALEAIEGKGVGGKKIRIRRESSRKNVQSCDILFISGSEKDQLEQLLEAIRGASVLTIGDMKGFAQQGVMINFYMEEKRVRFEINPKAAKHAGLRISSNLLKIARIVVAP